LQGRRLIVVLKQTTRAEAVSMPTAGRDRDKAISGVLAMRRFSGYKLTHTPLRATSPLAHPRDPFVHDVFRRLRRRLSDSITGSRSEEAGYNPHTFALGTSFLFALACVGLATLSFRLRWLHKKTSQDRAA
jgi:hypothetical protein